MVPTKAFQFLFKRNRQPGDLVFAIVFLIISVVLLTQLNEQTRWLNGKALIQQPRLWPAIGVIGMVVFGAFHLAGSLSSPRIFGRMKELGLWARSLEYVAWFLVYVLITPILGYLISTIGFMVVLCFRAGYRNPRTLLAAAAVGLGIVLLFKTGLQVKIPAGAIYEYLPDGLRAFMLTYM